MARRARDMILSLAVILVPLLALVGLWRFIGSEREVTVIDPAGHFAAARAAERFPVAEPTGLAKGWRPTSATVDQGGDGLTLRVGYLSPGDGLLQLVESDVSADRLLPRELGAGARAEGTVRVRDRDWQRYPGRGSERALVLLEPGRTILVLGQADERDLRDLAAALG